MASLAPALISGGASLIGGITSGKGASKAAKIQAAAYQQGINEQQREYNQTRSDNLPFLTAGQNAVTSDNGISALLGLSGTDAQTTALSSLKSSPLFSSIMGSGTDAILQNAAATGGLRGGNTQDALSRLGAEAFSSVYQNQLSNLMSLAQLGSNTGSTLANAGQSNANATSSLLTQQGNANATAAAAPYASLASGISGAANAYGSYYGQNALASLLKASTGGSSLLSSAWPSSLSAGF